MIQILFYVSRLKVSTFSNFATYKIPPCISSVFLEATAVYYQHGSWALVPVTTDQVLPV